MTPPWKMKLVGDPAGLASWLHFCLFSHLHYRPSGHIKSHFTLLAVCSCYSEDYAANNTSWNARLKNCPFPLQEVSVFSQLRPRLAKNGKVFPLRF